MYLKTVFYPKWKIKAYLFKLVFLFSYLKLLLPLVRKRVVLWEACIIHWNLVVISWLDPSQNRKHKLRIRSFQFYCLTIPVWVGSKKKYYKEINSNVEDEILWRNVLSEFSGFNKFTSRIISPDLHQARCFYLIFWQWFAGKRLFLPSLKIISAFYV